MTNKALYSSGDGNPRRHIDLLALAGKLLPVPGLLYRAQSGW